MSPFRLTRMAAGRRGFTIAELLTVVAIIGILAATALPVARFAMRRQKEVELRHRLEKITTAIDAYHDMRAKGLIKAQFDLQQGLYPRDLNELTAPIELLDGKRVTLLRERDLIDPITGRAEWRTISSTDDLDSITTNGDNVWDVRSTSGAMSLDGRTRYNEW